MKSALLDTSFIITCIKQKIDFFQYLESEGIQILIPLQVIRELKKLNAKLALRLLNKHKFKKIDLGVNNVDKGIINYAKKHNDVIIATLDRDIKSKVKNPKMVVRGRKKLESI